MEVICYKKETHSMVKKEVICELSLGLNSTLPLPCSSCFILDKGVN